MPGLDLLFFLYNPERPELDLIVPSMCRPGNMICKNNNSYNALMLMVSMEGGSHGPDY